MKNYKPLFSTAVLLALAGAAEGQITVDGWYSFNSQSASFSDIYDGRLSDKLVVVATGEHGFNNDNGDLLSLTYDGVAFTKAIDRDAQFANTDTIFADIWYLDDPRSFYRDGLIEVSAENRGNITVIGLSGTADGVGNVGVTPTDTRSINLNTSADSLVVASFSMGGAGNTANVLNVLPDAPLTQIAALENGSNWDGQIVGYHNNTTAGTQNYSFSGGNIDGSLVIAAEFLLGPPPPLPTLRVNTGTGNITLVGDTDDAVSMNYYEIISDGNSLDPTGWNSLADQDYDGNGPANGSGNGWEEAGGSGPHALAEAYLLGDSIIAPEQQINLGTAYDTTVDAQDLVFTFRTDIGKIRDGLIEYYASILGDLNDDAQVNEVDLSIVLNNFGATVTTGSLLDGDPTADGQVNAMDLRVVLNNWTATDPPSITIPEPGSLALLGVAGMALMTRRRRSA